MGKTLIIVESPTKIQTLKKFVGPQYQFESSVGHIRDLPEKDFGIDLKNDFDPQYVLMPEKENVISKLRKAAKECDNIILSPDPDREGEAIAWHITHVLPKDKPVKRVVFYSITKAEVTRALQNPRDIDMALVNAQQARRLLDRIVGYKISPILNRRIQRGKEGSVSAGRVQSVALKLVVDREKEIEAFIPVEYWNLGGIFKTPEDDKNFRANLWSVDGKKVEKQEEAGKNYFLIPNATTAEQVAKRMKEGPYEVTSVEKKEKKRNPVPPFITSTLQQEASRHFGFSAARTMNIAQSLYEGVDLGKEGAEGMITYMRTDSVRIAPEAIQEVRSYIQQRFGKEYIPEEPRFYTSKKSAQDAHEAIRPTNLSHPPEVVEKYLNRDQFLLYSLIWKRFVASQMVPAVYDTVSADIDAGKGIVLRATGSTIKFPGFLAVYEEKADEDDKDEEAKKLPQLEQGQLLKLIEWTKEQAFTRPPPRFTEASLVKELERLGIGRPSTYASIMNKIQGRDYTIKEAGRLKPTELGRVIASLLEDNFGKIMNVDFTAHMEDDLELIAENQKEWKSLIREFWTDFEPTLEKAEKEAFVPKIMTDLDCPLCGNKLQKIWFKSKYFYGCSHYPECKYSATAEELTFNKDDYAENFDWDQLCPKCEGPMKLRHGRFGAFLGCTTYPECKGIVNIPKKGEEIISQADMPECPAIDCTGHMVARKSRFGKTFFSCSTFPECDVIVNDLADLNSKYPEHVRTAYVKKAKGKRGAKKGAASKTAAKTTKTKATGKGPGRPKKEATEEKPEKKKREPKATPLSPELATFVGQEAMPRGEVLKKVWDYIREKNLQDAKDKRKIHPDAKLATIFGSQETIDMFKIAGLISPHLRKG